MHNRTTLPDRLLLSEAARVLERSTGTVDRWQRLGLLNCERTARGVRLFLTDEVLARRAEMDRRLQGDAA